MGKPVKKAEFKKKFWFPPSPPIPQITHHAMLSLSSFWMETSQIGIEFLIWHTPLEYAWC